MMAYKFLRHGRIGPFSGFRWPAPRAWARADKDTVACRRGTHACRTRDLPADELREIEMDGRVQVDQHKIFAAAGRLRPHVKGWTFGAATPPARRTRAGALEREPFRTRAGVREVRRPVAEGHRMSDAG